MYRRVQTLLIVLGAVVALSCAAWAQVSRVAISIHTSPGGGIVYLDNQRLGPAPITDWATSTGVHKITVRVNGQVAASRDMNIRKSQKITLNLKMPVRPAHRHH
jgi:hypothetical protein